MDAKVGLKDSSPISLNDVRISGFVHSLFSRGLHVYLARNVQRQLLALAKVPAHCNDCPLIFTILIYQLLLLLLQTAPRRMTVKLTATGTHITVREKNDIASTDVAPVTNLINFVVNIF